MSCFCPSITSLTRLPDPSGDQNKKRQADLLLGPYGPADPRVLKSVCGEQGCCKAASWKLPKENHSAELLDLRENPCPSLQITCLLRSSFGLLRGLVRGWIPNYGLSGDSVSRASYYALEVRDQPHYRPGVHNSNQAEMVNKTSRGQTWKLQVTCIYRWLRLLH